MKTQSGSRVWKLLLIGLALLGGTLVYIEYWQTRPIGSGPAGPKLPSEPFTSVWTGAPVLVLGVGDSITAGLGAQETTHSYFNRLLENPVDEFEDLRGCCLSKVIPNVRSLNLAISGSTSLTHLEVLREKLAQQPPDVRGLVLMTTGGNDIIHNYGRTATKSFANGPTDATMST